MRSKIKYLLFTFVVWTAIYGCERYELYKEADARLLFSADTIFFDTVFTTLGSTTTELKVYNNYDQSLEIAYIRLAGGEESVFRLNIDGVAELSASNIEIPPNDSLYIFVEVTLDPNNQDSILLIQDSIVFNTNGNMQDIDLMAWGQDVHIFNEETIQSTTWTNDKPYLILKSLLVDSMQTLSIEEGVRIHLHKNAYLAVKGSLQARGSIENPIIIQGDRLEQLYEDIPGQWDRIWFWPGHSENNVLENVIIKNGVIGIHADSLVVGTEPIVTLENCRILNMSAAGILASGTRLEASNTVVGNCGQFAMLLRWGGEYVFNHCTFANYWSAFSNRTTPSVATVNYYEAAGGSIQVREFEGITFGNSIIYGNKDFEFVIDNYPDTQTPFNFDHCLLKLDPTEFDLSDLNHFRNVINQEYPAFRDIYYNDYSLDTLSPAKDAGLYEIAIQYPFDLEGEDRLADGLPDIGAFERIESTPAK
jgi:hypothetical protein